MRKLMNVLIVAMMLGSVGFVASPATASSGQTCTFLAGPTFLKPPLPTLSNRSKVRTTIQGGSLEFERCTGPGGVDGKVTAIAAKANTLANCTTLGSGSPITFTGTMTITWLKGKASTLSVMFVTPTRKFPDATLTGTVTAGQFRGLHANAPIVYTPLAGSCGANPWSEVFPVLASKGKLVIN
jgi:hypothetical protein